MSGVRENGSSRLPRKNPSLRPRVIGSRTSANDTFSDILQEYLLLELGTSKKEIFDFVHLSQSMRFANSNSTLHLLNTITQSKIINTQLEIDFTFTCLCADQCQSHKSLAGSKSDDKLMFPCSHLEESNFKNQFFVTRNSFHVICTHLMQEYASTAYKRTEIDVEKQLLVTLTYLGTVLSYKEIGSKFNIAISTAHKCVNDVTSTLFKRMGELIYWPIDHQADAELQAFNELPENQFPGVLGVIGTVDLKKTCTSNPSKHTKDRTSIAIQCVCNTKYQFYNVFTSYLLKSSVTTSTFLESPLAEIILNNPSSLFPNSDCHIIGPSCYPLLPNLMTPFPENSFNSSSQNVYNLAISLPLNIIKLAFGKLLARFKRLLCLDLWGQEKFAILIFAACCLHNLCLGNNDDIDCEPYECCSFKCDYYDEYSIEKRREICNSLSSTFRFQNSKSYSTL